MMNGSSLTAIDSAEVEQLLNTVTRSASSALLLDYDGTLAPFTANREQAFPYEGVSGLLHDIMRQGRTRVVIITGRDANEVVSFLSIAPLPEIWGSHGLQRLKQDGSCEMLHTDPPSSEGLSQAGRWLAHQGLQSLTEFKPGAVALHWRGLSASRVVELHHKAVAAWSPIADRVGLSLLEFDGGIEIRMPGRDKGHAVRTIMREMGPDTPMAYLGDDVTDEHAFVALGSHGISILVRPEWRRTCARVWFKPPDDVLDFLTQWRQACA